MNEKEELVPKRRFKEFKNRDAWEQRKLKDIGELNRGKSKHRPRNDARLFGGKYPFIQTGDVAKAGLYLTEYDQTYSDFGIEQSKLWDEGTLLITIAANIAETSILGIKAAFPDSIIAFESEQVDMVFIKNVIDKVSDKLKRTAETSSQANLNLAKLSELNIELPSLSEQTVIASFFKQLDDTIALHQRKLDKAKELKSAYLSEMFPAEGERKPKRRFAGFTDDWEQRKLGEMGSTYTGLSGKNKTDFGHGEGRYVTYMNVFTNTISNSNMVEPIEIDVKQNEVKAGDVFFTTSSETPKEVGMSSVILENSPNTYLNSFCFGYRPIDAFDNHYLAYMLRSDSVRKNITFLAQGISRYNISKNKVMEIEVPITQIDEQLKIGSFFKQLDDTIALHQHKLEKLQTIKKAYLNEMFI